MSTTKPPPISNGLSSRSPSTMSPDQSSASTLTINRNKHWKYISSYHGAWLNLKPDLLESLANSNYSSPRPRPIDPAVFFDLVKIRKAVEEATDLAVRASTDLTSAAMNNLLKNSYNNAWGANAAAYGLVAPGGAGGNTKLSKERKFRMREKATQKLSQAYKLDEIAASVATMQSTSALENVANFVLEKKAGDHDAMYVHFFHEKIPSRSVANHTPLDTLDALVSERPSDGSPLRTLALTKLFKEDYAGAVRDLTEGLPVARHRQQLILARSDGVDGGRYREQALKEEAQPSSLEAQLLFHRAGAYVRLACQHINTALEGLAEFEAMRQAQKEALPDSDSELPALRPEERQGHSQRLESRKLVKTNAKRALRDYECFLSMLDYTAGQATSKDASSPKSNSPVHPVSSLFSSTPPGDLPPFPYPDSSTTQYPHELVTYHPLLTDALHSLLLCHALLQTSATELRRHALNAARLTRLSDGAPIFLAARSPARADWIQVLRHAPADWLAGMTAESWDAMSRPPGHRSWDVTMEDRDDEPAQSMTRTSAAQRIGAHAEREWQTAAGKRVNGIARWVREAPKSVEGGKKKKKPRAKRTKGENGVRREKTAEADHAVAGAEVYDVTVENEKVSALAEGMGSVELAP